MKYNTVMERLEINLITIYNKIMRHDYPCGRTKKDKFLCCRRRLTENTAIFSEDRKKVYCKYCDSIKAMSTQPFRTIDDMWGE